MHQLTLDLVNSYRGNYEKDKAARSATAAMAKTEMADLAFLPMEAAKLRGDFAIEIKTHGITAQEKSGRCWMFAAMNILREKAAENLGIEEFEISENYLAFYDKLEKANNFLNMAVSNAKEPLDGQMAQYIYKGIGDGGYWDMAVDLVKKYGVVPKWVMPESYQSSHTQKFMRMLNSLLRRDAQILREMILSGKSDAEVNARQTDLMAEVYKAECIAFGEPVRTFDLEWTDKNGAFHREAGITPLEFYERHVAVDLDGYVTVTAVPTEFTPEGRLYEFHYMGSMAESGIKVLNLSIDELEELTLKQMRDGEAVWFACDAGAYGDRKEGVWDPDSFDYEGLLGGVSIDMPTRRDRLELRDSRATHAMILVGVNFDEEGRPNRWKIENSWGGEVGKKGYFVCSEHYFREYVYEAVIQKEYLSDEQKAILGTDPVEVKPWIGDLL